MKYILLLPYLVLHIHLLAQDSPGLQRTATFDQQEQAVELIEKSLQLSDSYYIENQFEKAIEAANQAHLIAIKNQLVEYEALALNKQAWAWAQKENKKFAFQTIRKSQKLIRKNNIQNEELKNSNTQLLLQITGVSGLQNEFIHVQKAIEEAIEAKKEGIAQLEIAINEKKIEKDPLATSTTSPEYENKTENKAAPAMAAESTGKVSGTTGGKGTIIPKIPEIKLPDLPQVPTQAEIASIVQQSLNQINEKAVIEKRIFVEEIESEEEKIDALGAEEAKEELLFAHYKLKLDSLNNLHLMDSLNLVTAEANLLKRESELEQQKTLRSLNIVGATGSGILIAMLFLGYRRQKKNNELIRKEQNRSEELLLNILPAAVADELKEHGAAKAHKYDNVSVLFSDFKNFSKIAEKLSPEKLVSELDYCFKAFDNIIDKYQLEKIKTIGDAYMCAGGLPSPNDQNAALAVKAALEIQEFLEQWKAEKISQNEFYFEARIGIHTGPIVAGVVGVKKFAYDIWGDTVNIASRMESNSKPGRVNISDTTYKLVRDTFQCSYRGKVHAKNKGEIDMYFVEKQKAAVAL